MFWSAPLSDTPCVPHPTSLRSATLPQVGGIRGAPIPPLQAEGGWPKATRVGSNAKQSVAPYAVAPSDTRGEVKTDDAAPHSESAAD